MLLIGDETNYSFLASLWQDEQFDTLSEKLKNIAIFETYVTLKVNGGNLENIWKQNIACGWFKFCTESHNLNRSA